MKLEQIAAPMRWTLAPGDSIDKAVSLMEEHGIHHLPVCARGILVGMVSDRDLLLGVGWKLACERKSGGGDDGPLVGPRDVSDVMTRRVLRLDPAMPLRDAAQLMVQARISAIPLVDHGELVGIVTRFDMLSLVARTGGLLSRLAEQSVAEHMRASVYTLRPKDTVQDAFALMRDRHVRHVPIVAEDMIIGMVSDRDLRREIGAGRIDRRQYAREDREYEMPTPLMRVMSRELRTAEATDTIGSAATVMCEVRISSLPVVSGQTLLGIITDTDIVRLIGQAFR
jgi:CBS domain-containing protein